MTRLDKAAHAPRYTVSAWLRPVGSTGPWVRWTAEVTDPTAPIRLPSGFDGALVQIEWEQIERGRPRKR